MASKIIVDQLQKSGFTALTLPSANATTGQYLQDNGSGTLSWSTVGGATPRIGQVLQAQKTDVFTSASATWIDITDLSIAITPSASTSKLLVSFTVQGLGTHGSANLAMRLIRDSTAIAIGDAVGSRIQATHGEYIPDAGSYGMHAMSWLDEPTIPATPVAITYKLQGLAASTHTFYINRSQTDLDSTDYNRNVSTITVMEVLV
jgi:hypothetical protein